MKTQERKIRMLPGERSITRAHGPAHSLILTNTRIIQQRAAKGAAESTGFFLENLDSVETTTKTRPNLLLAAIVCFCMAFFAAIMGDSHELLPVVAGFMAMISFALFMAYIVMRTRVVAFRSQRSDILIHSSGKAIQSVPRFIELVEKAKAERMLTLAGLKVEEEPEEQSA